MANKEFAKPYDQEPSAPIALPITHAKPFLGTVKSSFSMAKTSICGRMHLHNFRHQGVASIVTDTARLMMFVLGYDAVIYFEGK